LNEHSGVTPVPATDVFSIGSSSAIDNDSENDQTDDGDNLDDCEPEFSFTVSTGSSKVDGTGDDEADCDPNCRVDVFRPVTDQDSGGVEFGRELFKAKERRKARSASRLFVDFFFFLLLLTTIVQLNVAKQERVSD